MTTDNCIMIEKILGRKRYYIKPYNFHRRVYLTRKEVDVISKLMQGKCTKEIAWELSSSTHTIHSHLANLRNKFACFNSFQLGLVLGVSGSKDIVEALV